GPHRLGRLPAEAMRTSAITALYSGPAAGVVRSEERRVGKEWRSRWSGGHSKKPAKKTHGRPLSGDRQGRLTASARDQIAAGGAGQRYCRTAALCQDPDSGVYPLVFFFFFFKQKTAYEIST